MALISLDNVSKIYPKGTRPALDDIDLDIERGDFVFLVGASGSGKTTLLSLLLREEEATNGEIRVAGNDLRRITNRQVPQYRRSLGFVFQDFNLLDTFSLRDNIFLPLVLSHKGHAEMAARLAPIARQLGIEALLDKYPYEVSGGQKQRAAVARALITKPEIVLADEPTGALDSKATTKLLRMFGEINRGGQTILMVTHSTRAASHAGRVLFIKDGVVFHQLYRGNMTSNEMFAKIGDTLTMLTTGGADRG